MESKIKTQLARIADIPSFLSLQAQNLSSNLTEEEKLAGFVTTPFTIPQIEEIIKQKGLFVAKDVEGKVIAYVFAGTWEYFSQWAIFNFMIDRFPQLSFKNGAITTQNSFQYGPVCIDKAYRGGTLLQEIFETMRLNFVNKYPISITFINKVNIPSTKAHTRKLGWEIIDEFEFNKNTYLGLAFDMSQSVLVD